MSSLITEKSIKGLKYCDLGEKAIVMIAREDAEEYFKGSNKFNDYLLTQGILKSPNEKSVVFYWKDFFNFLVKMEIITEEEAFLELL